jgi:hypothetical protein
MRRAGIATPIIAVLVALAVLFPATGSAQNESVQFRLTLTNTTNPEMILPPGALMIHQDANALWSPGGAPSLALERIAEIGNPTEAVANGAVELAAAPANGDTVVMEFTASPGDMLSFAQMLVATNDSFVGVNSLPLWTDGRPTNVTLSLLAWDAGSEDNAELFAGFDGGQPDPAMGMANVENGTATVDGVVTISDQFVGYQATVVIQAIGETVSVEAGLSLIGWTGADMTAADFLAANPDVQTIFVWVDGAWVSDSTILPEPLRVAITITRGSAMFVVTDVATVIQVPLA